MPTKAPTPCLACGSLGRCAHRAATTRPDGRRRSGWQVYNAAWRELVAAAITTEPWCHNPDGCPHPDAATPANPLTGDHVTPRAAGGTDDIANIRIVCRRCNSSKGART